MAVITMTTTALLDARASVAFGNYLQSRDANNVRRDATLAEIKADIIRYVTSIVLDDEKAVAARNAVISVFPFVPT